MKRKLVLAVCLVILGPVLPFYLLACIGEWLTDFASWAVGDRKWSNWFLYHVKQFANRHGVEI